MRSWPPSPSPIGTIIPTGHRKANVVDSVFDEVASDIVVGKLKPNDILPSTAEFGSNYEISRGSAREVIKKLVKAGLVDQYEGVNVVAKQDNTRLLEVVEWLLDFARKDKIGPEKLIHAIRGRSNNNPSRTRVKLPSSPSGPGSPRRPAELAKEQPDRLDTTPPRNERLPRPAEDRSAGAETDRDRPAGDSSRADANASRMLETSSSAEIHLSDAANDPSTVGGESSQLAGESTGVVGDGSSTSFNGFRGMEGSSLDEEEADDAYEEEEFEDEGYLDDLNESDADDEEDEEPAQWDH